MRVLLLNRYSLERTAGGVAEYLYYLPISLKSLGVETFAYNEDENNGGGLVGPRVSKNGVVTYEGPFMKPSFFVSNKKLHPLIEVCKKEKIDLIHAQGTYRCGWIARQVFKKTGIPYVVTSHADIVATNSDRMKRGKVRRRCHDVLSSAAKVTHLTPLMADISHEVCDTRDKSFIIGNGIDLKGWHETLGLPEQDYAIGIGRLEPEKGFHILISAYALLHAQGFTGSLVIAGTGSAEWDLQEQARRLNLNVVTNFTEFSRVPPCSIVFTGYIQGEIKKQLIGQSQLILFPTQPAQWEEPFGIVQIEAMAAAKPLIASDSLTTRYLQTFGLRAQLVQADNPAAWAGEIKKMTLDSAFRHQCGKMNLENAAQFDWSEIAKLYQQVYMAVMEK
ncbi:MAG: glycosyltransferase [Gammaproteobacteria bacterium]|nr:glycosyltransferase [Gammaproteobacteria bacterium]